MPNVVCSDSYLLFEFFVLVPRSNIGAAIAMDEYVPMMMPKPIAKVKPRSPEPPKMYIVSTTINVVKDVRMVLEIV